MSNCIIGAEGIFWKHHVWVVHEGHHRQRRSVGWRSAHPWSPATRGEAHESHALLFCLLLFLICRGVALTPATGFLHHGCGTLTVTPSYLPLLPQAWNNVFLANFMSRSSILLRCCDFFLQRLLQDPAALLAVLWFVRPKYNRGKRWGNHGLSFEILFFECWFDLQKCVLVKYAIMNVKRPLEGLHIVIAIRHTSRHVLHNHKKLLNKNRRPWFIHVVFVSGNSK